MWPSPSLILSLFNCPGHVGTNDVALSEVRTEKPLPQNGAGEVEDADTSPAQEEDRPRTEKSVLQGKLTKLAIQIGYGGMSRCKIAQHLIFTRGQKSLIGFFITGFFFT